MAPSCSLVRAGELDVAAGAGAGAGTISGAVGAGGVVMVESPGPRVTRAVMVVETRVIVCVTTLAWVTIWRSLMIMDRNSLSFAFCYQTGISSPDPNRIGGAVRVRVETKREPTDVGSARAGLGAGY